MSTQLLVKKLNREVTDLRHDLSFLRELLLASVKDSEGEYRVSFLKKMLRREKVKPNYRFVNPRSFLKDIHAAK